MMTLCSCLLITLFHSHGSLSGFVVDRSNGEKLAYANVYIEGTEFGAATSDRGYYFIGNIPAGSYTVVFSYIGYETNTQAVFLAEGQHLTVNVELNPATIEMSEVVVTAERTRFEREVEISHITFTKREITSVPALFEKDLIKTLQLMPGVVAMHDLSNKLYVRGGSPDENLALLDGITVYNPSSHLFGLFSTFDPDVISDAELYAGGFPVQYGDRLSSVLAVTTKEGNSKQYTGTASLGLITSKACVEGPLPKGSFLISGRRTYFDALVWTYSQIFNDTVSLPYYFYDGIAKINFNPSPTNRFTITGLGGADVLSFEESLSDDTDEEVKLDWGNRGLSGRWRRVFSPIFYGEMVAAWSNFNTHFSYRDLEDSTNNFDIHEDIIDYIGKFDLDVFLHPRHTCDCGIDAKRLTVRYNLDLTNLDIVEHEDEFWLVTGYLQDRWTLIPNILSVQAGIRAIYYSIGRRYQLNPHIGLKYHLGVNTALSLAVGKYSQYLITINSQESYFSIFDFWRPVDSTHSIPCAYHGIAGIEHWFDRNTKFTIEPYYKRYYNLLIPREYSMYFSQPTESLKVSTGYSTGVDIFFKKKYQNVFGWISYSLGYTRRAQGSGYYSPRYDRRHNLNIVLGYALPGNIPVINNARLNARWSFATGLPYAEDLGRYRLLYYDEVGDEWYYEWVTIKGPRDAYRLPSIHRLDLHLEKDIRLFGLTGFWYIDVINVYNRKNIAFYTLDESEDPPEKDGFVLLPIPIPSIGVTFRF